MDRRSARCRSQQLLRALVLGAATLSVGTQVGAAAPSAIPDFEGIWLPNDFIGGGGSGGPVGPGGPGPGDPGGSDGAGASGAAATGGPGGPPGGFQNGAPGGGPSGGPPMDQVVNCAPLTRLDGGGGGDSDMIVQSPRQILLLSEEWMDVARRIYISEKHPAKLKPQPNGHSIGHWEGNALVVDTIGYADKDGNDIGQHVVERWTRDGDKLTSKATVTDKSGKSTQRTFTWTQEKGLQYNESVCEEAYDRFQYVNGQLIDTNTADQGARSSP